MGIFCSLFFFPNDKTLKIAFSRFIRYIKIKIIVCQFRESIVDQNQSEFYFVNWYDKIS